MENSNTELNYVCSDSKPLKGVSYYRLNSVDRDQTFDYSQIEIISIATLSNLALVYPNPNAGAFNISLIDPSMVRSIEIYNATVQLVRKVKTKGKNDFVINGLSNGFYNLSIIGSNERFVTSIVVSQ